MNIKMSWLGGAGFVIKADGITVGVDLYLSNACMRPDGSFKRLTPAPAKPDGLNLDYLIASHEHGDHLDIGSLKQLVNKNNSTCLIAPTTAIVEAKKILGNEISSERFIILNRGESYKSQKFTVRACLADHGTDSIDAIGFFLCVGNKNIYFIGDTCFRTDMSEIVKPDIIDIMLVPINGRFGNPDSKEAAYFMQMFKPGLTIPCHYWLFAEHGGDPGEFLRQSDVIAPGHKKYLMAIGEEKEF
ncbi:MAG: MBL fold metallo-hydrolase [Defluviitaleaceae bacterium]|nr:MBL fold metallo-hydrolase [Defluviitaleaceae bacterium]